MVKRCQILSELPVRKLSDQGHQSFPQVIGSITGFHNRQRRSSGRPSPQEPRRARTAADSSRQPVWHWPRQMDDRGRTRRPS